MFSIKMSAETLLCVLAALRQVIELGEEVHEIGAFSDDDLLVYNLTVAAYNEINNQVVYVSRN